MKKIPFTDNIVETDDSLGPSPDPWMARKASDYDEEEYFERSGSESD